MKKYLIGFIFGAIIFGTIGVYAGRTYLASDINYTKSNNTTVSLDTALNELYTSASALEYVLPDYITPTEAEQSYPTQGKKLTKNLVIKAIPSNYKNVSDSTISQASDILSGKSAYLSNGTKVTGTRKECVYNTVTCTTCNSSNGQEIASVAANFFIIVNNDATHLWYYNSQTNSTNFMDGSLNDHLIYAAGDWTNKFTVKNNKLYAHNWSSNPSLKVLACKL